MDLETKIKALITRIEDSGYPDEDKEEIYQTISGGLHDIVLPTLLHYVPQEEIEIIANAPTVDADAYEQLLIDTATKTEAIPEMQTFMHQFIDQMGEELSKHDI